MLNTVPKPSTCAGCPAYTKGGSRRTLGLPAPSATVTLLHSDPTAFRAGHKAMYDRHIGRSTPVNHDCLVRCEGAKALTGVDRRKAVDHCRQYDHWTTRALMVAGDRAWRDLHPAHLRYQDWLGYMSPHVLDGRAVFATLSMQDLYDTDRLVEARAHLGRVQAWLAGRWPSTLPTPVTGLAALSALDTLATLPPTTVALDTEFDWTSDAVPGHHHLTMLGLGWRVDGQVQLVQFDHTTNWELVWARLALVLKRHSVVMQNAAADVPVLAFNGGPQWSWFTKVEDLMLAHATLYAGWPHDLKYLRSVGGALNMPKVFREAAAGTNADFATYNAGDVYETLCLWEAMAPLVSADTGFTRCYRTLVDLVPVHTEASSRGIHVDKGRVAAALQQHLNEITDVLALVEAYVGRPLPLTGKEMQIWLTAVEGFTPVKSKKTKKATWDKDAITTLRGHYLPVDAELETKVPLTMTTVLERIEAGAHPLLEAKALYSRVFQSYTHYILPLVKGVDDGDTQESESDASEVDT